MKFLKLPEVMERCALSRASIYSFIGQKRFPQQVVIGGRAVAWIESEIDEWLEQRIARRGGVL